MKTELMQSKHWCKAPRGRRLLLEFVLASERQRNLDSDEEPFNSAVFLAFLSL